MSASISVKQTAPVASRLKITWLLVVGLFILRIPLLAGSRIVAPETSSWALAVCEIGTYFLTALLIWWERDRLADYHVDKLVLIIFILGKPLELLINQLEIPFIYLPKSAAHLLYLPIAVGLGVVLLVARPQLPKLNRQLSAWMIVGVLTGIALGVGVGLINRTNAEQSSARAITWELLIALPIVQMLFAGLTEEPFFRGFLWGSLHKLGLKGVWVWLIQAGLFWLAHIYYLAGDVALFWSSLPAGLVLGLLAWRSRSIAVSVVAHGFANGLGQIIGFYA